MLRITRLHVLLAAIGMVCLFVGVKDWWGQHRGVQGQKALPLPPAPEKQKPTAIAVLETAAMDQQKKNVTQSVATIGDAYRILQKQYGEIPPIGKPLRAAKFALSKGDYELAMTMARTSWAALKKFRKDVNQVPESYQVTRGDTLWRIAAMHSPAHAGAGWVTIWRANQSLVNDFNRIEVGMMLKIPQRRAQYVMPFWRPRTP